jgi:hypothetical protein
MPRTYVPKKTQGCVACGARGHNARSPLCPVRVAKASAAAVLHAFVRELEAEKAGETDPAVLRAYGGMIRAAARAAAKVAS